MQDYDITAARTSQAVDLVRKLKPRKEWALKALPWLSKHVSISALCNYQHCGDYMTMLTDAEDTRRKIETAFFCKQRLCPGCAWRASLRDATCVSAISQAMDADGWVMLMATLTVPNVQGDVLRETCRRINTAWDKLMHRAAYRAAWANNIRKLEITYNAQRNDYHPHLHIIVFVRPSYFAPRKGQNTYISRDRLLTDWRAAYADDSITQVDVRRCRDSETGSNAILEVSKYCAKAADFTTSETVYDTMYKTLWHLRTMTYAGRCRALRADYDAGLLDNYLPTDTTEYVWRLVYRYYAEQGYQVVEREPYQQEESRTDVRERLANTRVLAREQDLAAAREGIGWREQRDIPEWADLLAEVDT